MHCLEVISVNFECFQSYSHIAQTNYTILFNNYPILLTVKTIQNNTVLFCHILILFCSGRPKMLSARSNRLLLFT